MHAKSLLTVHTVPATLNSVRDIDIRDRRTGYSRIGYHYVITLDGTVHTGRPLTEASVHDNSRHAIAVCVVADGKPNEQQREAVRLLVRSIINESIKIVSKSPVIDAADVL